MMFITPDDKNHIKKHEKGRQLLIPDIHGCAQTFEALLNKIQLTKDDQLILLGDYINRGSNNSKVLEIILKLIKLRYQIFPLRGNHEQMALDSHENRLRLDTQDSFPKLQKRKGLTDKNNLLLPEYYYFFKSLPYYYETETYLISHAGFNFQSSDPFKDYHAMLWTDEHFEVPEHINKQIIRGHIPTALDNIYTSVEKMHPVITLDNGCYMRSTKSKGNLLCLNLTKNELIIKKNIEN